MGAFFVGTHMAMTHGVTLAMMSSYIPTTQVAGIGRISGTAWSFTDFIFGASSLFRLLVWFIVRKWNVDDVMLPT